MWTLQVTEPFLAQHKAEEALESLRAMTGFLGGTYGEQNNGHFYVQAFFRAGTPDLEVDGPEYRMDSLPGGTKHVFVPPVLQRWYGFTEAT